MLKNDVELYSKANLETQLNRVECHWILLDPGSLLQNWLFRKEMVTDGLTEWLTDSPTNWQINQGYVSRETMVLRR